MHLHSIRRQGTQSTGKVSTMSSATGGLWEFWVVHAGVWEAKAGACMTAMTFSTAHRTLKPLCHCVLHFRATELHLLNCWSVFTFFFSYKTFLNYEVEHVHTWFKMKRFLFLICTFSPFLSNYPLLHSEFKGKSYWSFSVCMSKFLFTVYHTQYSIYII